MTTRIAIVGYGNVGRGVERAISKNNELYGDVETSAIITRRPEAIREQITSIPVHSPDVVEQHAEEIADVAILCGGSANDLPVQGPYFAQFMNTVDSFDTHAKLPDYFKAMDAVARENGHIAVISTGWDPGTFSLERVLADAFIPGANAHGFYGLGEKGGLSMGHSDAIRGIEGVADARQYTHAILESIDRVRSGENPVLSNREMHTRECVVVAEEGADKARIADEIKNMPNYFEPYETTVTFVSQKELDEDYSGMPHDGLVIARGETGDGNAAMIEYKNQWESNPEATGNVLVAHARAAKRLHSEGQGGAKTILDIPAAYFSPHSRDELLRDFM